MKNTDKINIFVDARALQNISNGLARYLREIITHILDKSNSYYFILASNNDIVFQHKKQDSFKILIDKRFRFIPGTIWLQIRGNYLARQYNSNIFWSPTHISPIFRHKKLKYLLTVHDVVVNILPESMEFKNRIVNKFLFKLSLKASDYIVCVSKTTLKDLKKFYPFVNSKATKVVYSGKSLDDSYDGEYLDDTFLFVLGSLEPRKNILYLIKSFEILKKEIKDLKLYITGAQGWSNNDIKNYIDEKKLEANIKFTGYLTDEEIKKHLLSSKAFIFPSLYEGFGLPLLEAENKSVVIASDIEIFRELGEYMENLNFIDFKKDIHQSAKEIANILKNNNQDVLKFRTDQYAELFTWNYSAKMMIHIFNNILDIKS
jgi:glycosyltransferase involved in cell wall biosynthesis